MNPLPKNVTQILVMTIASWELGDIEVIIMDLDDPLEGGPCYWLYCKEFLG